MYRKNFFLRKSSGGVGEGECTQNNDLLVRGPSSGSVHGPLRELTIRNGNEAYNDRMNSKRDLDKFWRQFSFISHSEAILGRFEAACVPAYIQLALRLTGHSFNMDADSLASRARREATYPDLG